MTRALVTGGAGFLGSHIADALGARGYDVTVFDLRASPYLQPGHRMVVGNILDPETVAKAMEGVDHVFHLAGFADLNAARSQPLDTANINILGTLRILDAARAVGVDRFVFASTVYVYSREGGFYRCSKQACEAYIEEYQRCYGLEYTVLRYGSLYGPRADESNGVYRLLRSAMLDRRIQHTGAPDEIREYVHVQDAARLSVDALEPEYTNQHLTITGHYPMRIADLFTMFEEILGEPLEVAYVGDQSISNGHYRVTPYAYTPRVGRKLTSNHYVDMGQGVLQLVEEIAATGHEAVAEAEG